MFIDAAILITTKEDDEFIQAQCRHVEQKLFLPQGFIEVFRNVRDNEDSKRGCFNAHFEVYQHIAKRGINTCLVLEDDVHFIRSVKPEEYAAYLSRPFPIVRS